MPDQSKAARTADTLPGLETQSDPAKPNFADSFRTFGRIGLLSFGGPTAQISMMHKVIVDEKKWLDEPQFLNTLSFCMLLPGPEATQLAIYAGWRRHGVAGGIMAGLLFVLPGAAVVLALAMIYGAFGTVPIVEAIFFGIKAAVLVIVVEALLRVAKRALKLQSHWIIAAISFAGIFLFALPFPLIVCAAAAFGFVTSKGETVASAPPGRIETHLAQTVGTIVLWSAIWLAPLAALAGIAGPDHILTQVGWFFTKLAVVTFGGAYAVLAYMAQDVVQRFHWLAAGEMMDGLGLAETTPGPLILVTEFVGYLAAFKRGGMGLGLAGALVALWSTFAPCFLWIFAGAPYIESIIARPRLKGALAAITAAVVGVILNLAVWFALQVFFKHVSTVDIAPIKVLVPDLASLDWRVVVLATISGFLLLGRHWGIAAVLCVASVGGLALRFAGL